MTEELNNQTIKSMLRTTTTSRELQDVAAEIKQLYDRFNELDSRPNATGPEKVYRESEMQNLTDRADILRNYLSVRQAASMPDVLVQIQEAALISDMLSASEPQDGDYRQLGRLFASVVAFLRQEMPEVGERIGNSCRHTDPWIAHEEQLQMIGVQVEATSTEST